MSDRFRKEYKELSDVQKTLIHCIKNKAEELEKLMCAANPTRELSLALTNLEQSVMWAVKAITLNY